MQKARFAWIAILWASLPCGVWAQIALIDATATRQPLISVRATADATAIMPSNHGGSLFIGQSGNSLLAPYPKRVAPTAVKAPEIAHAIGQGTPQLIALRRLIADTEAGPLDYDAVQYGARIKPTKPPTQMTLGEIYVWINQTPGQPHAIGRYQFIPETLRSLVSQLDLPLDTRFSSDVQDQLADILLDDAGLAQFTSGQISRQDFMNNLAKIWAGFPNSSGRSHYHGYAGNKASISWNRFNEEMQNIFGA